MGGRFQMGGRRAGNCAERHDHLSFDHVALVMAENHPGGDARQPIGHTDMKLTSMTRGMSISSLWSCHPCLSWPPTEWSSDTKPPLPISVTALTFPASDWSCDSLFSPPTLVGIISSMDFPGHISQIHLFLYIFLLLHEPQLNLLFGNVSNSPTRL